MDLLKTIAVAAAVVVVAAAAVVVVVVVGSEKKGHVGRIDLVVDIVVLLFVVVEVEAHFRLVSSLGERVRD